MKRLLISVAAAGILCSVSPLFANDWQISYGKEKGTVAVFNSKTDPKFAEDAPIGPMAFRVLQNQLWLLDSIGGKLIRYSEKGEAIFELKIQGLPENVLLEDFALVKGNSGSPETVWVAEAADCAIRKISLANGKELVKIGGSGNVAGKFLQISQLETDYNGRLYAGDCGRNVISVFTAYGEPVREIAWQNSGFAIDSANALHILEYRENAGYFHVVYSQAGQPVSSRHVGLEKLQNPRIWGLSDKGELLVSFIPEGGFKGRLSLLKINSMGKIIDKTELVPPGNMNRFVDFSGDSICFAEADFFAAPEGKFAVKSLNWDGKK
jgi:hypothetical protein